jgi:hypothetical protein
MPLGDEQMANRKKTKIIGLTRDFDDNRNRSHFGITPLLIHLCQVPLVD